jgi:hypothetical protein
MVGILLIPTVIHEMVIKGFETEILQTPGSIHYCACVFLHMRHPFYGKQYDEINRIIYNENYIDDLNCVLTESYFIHGDFYWSIGFNTDQHPDQVFTLQETINKLIGLVDLLV